ncbi:MAG: hypothetical protein GXP55_17875 [Deltaproteobacteria bacterium]|nr:hypothetical protein [Deltaproteobacteria bacterium]
MADPDPDAPVLFCPFCRECYEGETLCPEHELVLVPFSSLPEAHRREVPGEFDLLSLFEPRFGRAVVFSGALAMLVGFFGTFASSTQGARELSSTGLQLASTVALNLWFLPMVAGGLLSILARRRTPASLRSARLAIALLGAMGAMAVGYSFYRIHVTAAQLAQRSHELVEVSLGWGAWLALVGVVVAFVGGLRVGRPPAN